MPIIAPEDASRPGISYNVPFVAAGGASAVSAAFGTQTQLLRITVQGTGFVSGTGGCRVKVGGASVVAGPNDLLLPITMPTEYITVFPGQQIAVIGNDAGIGSLNVVEMGTS
jgi:hypothetical protein